MSAGPRDPFPDDLEEDEEIDDEDWDDDEEWDEDDDEDDDVWEEDEDDDDSPAAQGKSLR